MTKEIHQEKGYSREIARSREALAAFAPTAGKSLFQAGRHRRRRVPAAAAAALIADSGGVVEVAEVHAEKDSRVVAHCWTRGD